MTIDVEWGELTRVLGIDKRHPTIHFARADSASQYVYIMHSVHCLETVEDFWGCEYAAALRRGILKEAPWSVWEGCLDRTVAIEVRDGWLYPLMNVLEP